jgi:RNA polymerase sigma factor (sigma-70 family)
MTALARAQAGDGEAFRELTDPYRHELQLHCYRILGSVQDAEDMLQETLLAAWRGLDAFEERSSMRSWLYKIATNRCLNALRDSGRRPQTAAGSVFLSPPPEPTRRGEPLWLQPYPDALLEDLPDAAPSGPRQVAHSVRGIFWLPASVAVRWRCRCLRAAMVVAGSGRWIAAGPPLWSGPTRSSSVPVTSSRRRWTAWCRRAAAAGRG